MSWRLILALLAVLVLASLGMGLFLGRWILTHSPAINDHIQKPLAALLSPDGEGGVPGLPPQPLLDGRLAVPQIETVSQLAVEIGAFDEPFDEMRYEAFFSESAGEPRVPEIWVVRAQGLEETLSNPRIATATTSISLFQARQIAAAAKASTDANAKLAGGGVAGALDVVMPLQVNIPGLNLMQPSVPVSVQVPGSVSGQTGEIEASVDTPALSDAWQAELSRALRICETTFSLFDRPGCVWAARNRYCAAHQAWGQIENCPARNF